MTHPDLPGVPRVVVDPNVWVSAAISSRPGPPDALLTMAAEARILLLVSDHMLDELTGVLGREKFRRYLSHDEAASFVRALRLLGQRVEDVDLTGRRHACRDPEDEYLVALAEVNEAALLVSGDKDVLAVDVPGPVVRSPRDAVDVLGRHQHPWGAPLTPAEDPDAERQAAAEGHAEVLSLASLFLQVLADPGTVHLLAELVTPESLAAWHVDLASTRARLAHRGMTTRPDRPTPSCAYVELPPDPGQTIRATGDVLLPAGTVVLTVQHRPELRSIPELGGWRVHAVGEPVLPEHLPPAG